MFEVDGLVWDIPCTIQRTAEVKSSEISGLMLDRSYYNDVIGTYMSYTVKLAVPKSITRSTQFYAIYEAITNPQSSHNFVFPYNFGSIVFEGRVSNISDIYVQLPGGGRAWRGIQFTVTANEPSKTPSAS